MPSTVHACEVSLSIDYEPAWVSWVNATTMCLKALGVHCDATDVAGYSGYAFALAINAGVCPSGPTSLDWGALAVGPMSLGRSTLSFASGDCHTDGSRCDRTRKHCRHVLELARHEIEAGRPCVVWGAGLPEFGVVRGIEDGDTYVLVEGGPIPDRVQYDAIDAPGGPYFLGFPTVIEPHTDRDLAALARALQLMQQPGEGPNARRGTRAYTFWMSELQDGRAAMLGHSYNAQCWAEARRHAARFIERLVDRHGPAAIELEPARDSFHRVASHVSRVAEMFPFTAEDGTVEHRAKIDDACAELRQAQAAEEAAIRSIQRTLRLV
jgi:hypothetical protein